MPKSAAHPDGDLPVKLDVKDMKLLALLREDSRMPVSGLSKRVGMNRDTVTYRVRRMEQLRVIRKHYAEIDRSVFGYFVCKVFMVLDEVSLQRQRELMQELRQHPNTEALLEYNDKWDVQWRLLAKDLEELDTILMRISTKYSDIISERDTLVVVRWGKARSSAVKSFDATDLAILRLLADDARTSAVDIAKRIEIGPDAVIKRIKRLKETGIIKRFTIITDPQRMGRQWYTIAVQMKQFDERYQQRVLEFVRTTPAVARCVKTVGTWDILAYIAVGSTSEFHRIFKEFKAVLSPDVRNYEVFVGYTEHFITSLPRAIIEGRDT
jgi:DNA-binding Lrp family transcriptional regulator